MVLPKFHLVKAAQILLKMNFRGLIIISRLKDRKQKEREGKQHDNELRDTKRQRQRLCRKGRGGDESSKGDRNRVLND